MQLSLMGSQTLRAAKLSGFASFLLLIFVVLAASPAKADTIFNVNANILNGPFAGTDVLTGTIDINTTTGQEIAEDLTLSNDPSIAPFTGVPTSTTYISTNFLFFFNSGFADFGQLVLGNTVGYLGGSLGLTGGKDGLGSFIDINSNGYHIDGTVSPQLAADPAVVGAPEPSSFVLLALGMIGMLFVSYRRGLFQGM